MKLNAAWLNAPEVQQLLTAMGPLELRFVGGCVRDTLMDREVGDLDAATPSPPKIVMEQLQEAGIKVVPTGIAHGTVTAIISGKPFEITTLRRDVACDGRHAEVEFTDRWEEDAQRRDFTLNALYLDASSELYDYTDGAAAARAGRIAFIGDPSARITEDALRILRFFRFTATHGSGEPNADAIAACTKHKSMLADLSGERIQQEMLKLLSAEHPQRALAAMAKSGVLHEVLSIDQVPALPAYVQHPLLRLALMLPNEAAARAIAERWKLSNHDRDVLLLLITHPEKDWPEDDSHILGIARHLAPDTYRLLLMRNGAQLGKNAETVTKTLSHFNTLAMPVFPVTGTDLIAAGIASGPEMGETLRTLEAQWEKSGYSLSKDELLNEVK